MAIKSSFKKSWVKALKSGEYEQGHSHLRTCDNKYCCLGVAWDLLHPGRKPNDDVLSRTDRRKIGLGAIDQATLIYLNDSLKFSFKTIAKWIEKNL